nr:colicin D domain-containing protein [Halogeometricum borinquense]
MHVQRIKNDPKDNTVQGGTESKSYPDSGIDFPDPQLNAKFKHANDFGIDGNWNKENKQRFEQALREHITDKATKVIEGTYHKQPAIHYYNPQTKNNVMIYPDGEFWSAWKLSGEQEKHLLTTGDL